MYSRISNFSVRCLMRIIFDNIHGILIDYDHLWNDPSNNVAKTISQTISYNINKIKKFLDFEYFIKLGNEYNK